MLLLLGGISMEAQMPTALGGTTRWDWAELPTIEGLPARQFVARGGTRWKLEARLHSQLGIRPSRALAELEALGDSAAALPLQLGTGRILSYVVLVGLEQTWSWTLPDGELLMADVSLDLEPHRPPDPEGPVPLAVIDTAGAERTAPAVVDAERDPGEVPLSEIVRA
jgi:phage protein U